MRNRISHSKENLNLRATETREHLIKREAVLVANLIRAHLHLYIVHNDCVLSNPRLIFSHMQLTCWLVSETLLLDSVKERSHTSRRWFAFSGARRVLLRIDSHGIVLDSHEDLEPFYKTHGFQLFFLFCFLAEQLKNFVNLPVQLSHSLVCGHR